MRVANRDRWACGFWISTDEAEDVGCVIQNGMVAASDADTSGVERGGPGGLTGAREEQERGEGGKDDSWIGEDEDRKEKETTRAGRLRARRRRRGGNTHARKHEICTVERGHGSERGRTMDHKKREAEGADTGGVPRAGLESGIELGSVWSRAEDEALVGVRGGLEAHRRDATMGTGASTRWQAQTCAGAGERARRAGRCGESTKTGGRGRTLDPGGRRAGATEDD
ncbi:hypothetical protein DFH09DRAFT_1067790 [Mycena vulgaris]|nr:hypothetical protein DFH09DRAFT_1067790 [Mycena vulgaris]